MEYQVTKIAGPYVFNDDDQLLGPDGKTPFVVPEGHRVEMLKGKGDKGKPMVCYIVPDLSTQYQMEIIVDGDSTVAQSKAVGAMAMTMIDRNQKLRLNEFDDGELAAQAYVLDIAALAERFFIDGRLLGVKQAMIEEWIDGVLNPYMVARIAKNTGFTQAQKDSLVAALTHKFKIASTRDNETRTKKDGILQVDRDALIDLKKRLEQYSTDENNLLPASDELTSMQRRIDKHLSVVKVALAVTNDQF